MHKCSTCKLNIGTQKFHSYTNKKGEVCDYYKCRDCSSKHTNKYRKTETGRLNTIKAIKKSTEKYYFKQIARLKVASAIKKGLLKKPNHCSICSSNNRIQAHHHDYNMPLDVIWLCTKCHADEEKHLRTTKKLNLVF